MDDLDLLRLVDETRTARALVARGGRRALTQAAVDQATLRGTLLDLAEAGADVVLRTTAGDIRSGRVVGVGDDFVAVGHHVVRLTAVATVLPTGSTAPASGDRTIGRGSLWRLLEDLVGDRPRLTFVLTGGARVAGEVVAVGTDVLTLGGETGACYVSADSIVELFRSG